MEKNNRISELDRYLFHEGTHLELYKVMGAHFEGDGTRFVIWAPHAHALSVVGDFNGWKTGVNPLTRLSPEGIWEGFVAGLKEGDIYKYYIETSWGKKLTKSDPFAFYSEVRPHTASKVYNLEGYQWHDDAWMQKRLDGDVLEKPISIYEVNLSSWKRDDHRWYTYRELAERLIPYTKHHGFTHIELMPVMEHPYDGSWGYQITGYYSVTSRFGEPKDLMYFIDQCHQAGLGVILDWVPGHYCKDDHGLALFDGQPLFEPEDSILRENIEWGTMNFDYGRPEVRAFLISNACFWMDYFHADGLRVDAVAYMLHKHMGTGRYDIFTEKDINDPAVKFLQQLNTAVFGKFPNTLMIAEESSAFPLVTRPVHDGGLGFNLKWNMGWMHDSLKYLAVDPIGRKHHQDALTFSIYYAFNENFLLPLSHDEVVHGKKSLIGKMPGDYWRKFANYRLLMAYQTFHPGKKLNFMGNEFAQFIEWNEWDQLDWHLLTYDSHKGANACFRALNHLYRDLPELYELEFVYDGFEWVEFHNHQESIISFLRKDKAGNHVLAAFNFTPVVRENYPLKVPRQARYQEILNTDHTQFFGSGVINVNPIDAYLENPEDDHYTLRITLPPLGAVLLKPDNQKEA